MMLYRFRSIGQTAGAGLALLLTPLGFGTVSAECVDYADYAQWVGSAGTPDRASGVAISGSYAYLVDGAGLWVIDITDPTSPQFVGNVDTPNAAVGVSILGSHAHVADGWSGLQVIDITDPTSPELVGSVNTPNFAREVSISGSHAYIADRASGLVIVPVQCVSPPSSVDPADPGQPGLPTRFELLGASPNPFTASTSIAFDLPVATAVTLRVYDVRGRLVRDLVSGTLPAGRTTATWDGLSAEGRPVMSGTYFYRLQAGELQETRKVVYIRQSVSSNIR